MKQETRVKKPLWVHSSSSLTFSFFVLRELNLQLCVYCVVSTIIADPTRHLLHSLCLTHLFFPNHSISRSAFILNYQYKQLFLFKDEDVRGYNLESFGFSYGECLKRAVTKLYLKGRNTQAGWILFSYIAVHCNTVVVFPMLYNLFCCRLLASLFYVFSECVSPWETATRREIKWASACFSCTPCQCYSQISG